MKKGFFLTFEGPDGCGKSTQAKLMADYLTAQGQNVVLTREPGGTPLAEMIRELILTPTAEQLVPMAEILLYAASRAQHVERLIKPSLAEGKIVVCDRFIDSSLAYQGFGLGRDLRVIKEINRLAIGDFQPNLTFLLDIDTETALKRIGGRTGQTVRATDRIEARNIQYRQRVRDGFLTIAAAEPRIVTVATGTKSIADLHAELLKIVVAEIIRQGGELG